MSDACETAAEVHLRHFDAQVSEFAQPKTSLLDSRHRWNEIALDMVSESVVFFSAPQTRLIHVNRAACQCLGYSQQQLQDLSLLDIAPHANHGKLAEIIRLGLSDTSSAGRIRTVYRHRNGCLIPVHCSIRKLGSSPDSILVAVARTGDTRDDSIQHQPESNLRDALTRLPNRTWLWRQLERTVRRAKRSDSRFAVFFIDVDRFKAINDTFGHLAGDQGLQAVARRLTTSVRPEDVVARYGGDEFVVIMKDVHSAKHVRRIARRISRCVNAAGTSRGCTKWQARITVSIGVAIGGGRHFSAAEAVDRADRAMYRAKALGRNGQIVIDELPDRFGRNLDFGLNSAIGQENSKELE